MKFPDETAKLQAGRISNAEREKILISLGEVVRIYYDGFIMQYGSVKGYSLGNLKGSVRYVPDLDKFDNDYYLKGSDEHWTDVANYFEYGTGIYNTKRSGKYRAGYIRPVFARYMKFVTKEGRFVVTEKVKGIEPSFALQKAIKTVEFNRPFLQRIIRLVLRDG